VSCNSRFILCELTLRVCSVEYKKEQVAKGVPESELGTVMDRPPLPGTPRDAEVMRHVLAHQGVLRRLRDKVILEAKEAKVKMEDEAKRTGGLVILHRGLLLAPDTFPPEHVP